MRKEITALRAIAVIAVLLYHAKIPFFEGSYLGVDVFFVISGYLITGKILSEINKGTFTLRRFYLNRAKRLLPAYFVLSIVTSIFVFLYFFPDDIRNYANSLTYSTLYISNFFFWKDSNYFSKAIELKPLAHTWSLSIEEQFYLFLPISIILVYKLNKKYLKSLLLLGALLSFLITIPDSFESYTKFYLLPFRVWEMLVGSCLIFINKKKVNSDKLTLFGLLLIAASFTKLFSNIDHPGYVTLPVILGTSLIILYGRNSRFTDTFFSLKPINLIGLSSYSIYLWHYPIFVFNTYFEKYYKFEIYNSVLFSFINYILIAISIFVGYISWRYIENYFRYKYDNTKVLLSVLTLLTSVIFITGLNDTLYEQSKERYVNYVNIIEPKKTKDKYEKVCLIMDEVIKIDFRECINTEPISQKNILFIGDSLAHNLHNGFISFENNINTSLISATGCAPYLLSEGSSSFLSEKCVSFNSDINRAINNYEFDYIIVVANYINFLEDNLFHKNNPDSLEIFKNQILNFTENKNAKVVIIGQFPQWNNNLPNVLAGQIYTKKKLQDFNSENLDTQTFLIESYLEKWANENEIKYISILDKLCSDNQCRQIIEIDNIKYSTSFDSIHLSKEVSTYISKIIERELDE